MSELIKTGQASTHLSGGAEFHEGVEIDTDASGDGSSTVSWDEDFDDGDVAVIVTGTEGGDFFASSAGSSQATVNVEGASTTEGTVTCHVFAAGNR